MTLYHHPHIFKVTKELFDRLQAESIFTGVYAYRGFVRADANYRKKESKHISVAGRIHDKAYRNLVLDDPLKDDMVDAFSFAADRLLKAEQQDNAWPEINWDGST